MRTSEGWAEPVSEETLYEYLPEHVGGGILGHILDKMEIDRDDNDVSNAVLLAMRMTVAEVLEVQREASEGGKG